MTRNTQLLTALAIGSAVAWSSPTLAVPTTIFSTTLGSDNDGVGGFTQSADNFYGGYTTNTDNVQWFQQNVDSLNGGPGTDTNGGLNNNSLLQAFALDRSVGNAYTISGTMKWSAEADRNNRQGIYLFGDEGDLVAGSGENETGALSFLYNSDDQDILYSIGIDQGGQTSQAISSPDVPDTNSYYTDEQLTFQAEVTFVNNGGVDEIDITFTMFNNFGGNASSDTLDVTVDAATYTGDFFGFAGRTRDDGDGNSIAKYETFSIIQTAVPEPSSLALMGLGGLLAFRRRRSA